MNPMQKMKELVKKLNEADAAYFQKDNPIMTDREYDAMLLELTMPSAGMRTYRTGCDANRNPIEYSTHIIPGKKCTMVFDHEK